MIVKLRAPANASTSESSRIETRAFERLAAPPWLRASCAAVWVEGECAKQYLSSFKAAIPQALFDRFEALHFISRYSLLLFVYLILSPTTQQNAPWLQLECERRATMRVGWDVVLYYGLRVSA